MESSSSPGSRTRLVVASQALEIQHLQDLVRSREIEIEELTNRLRESQRKLSEEAHAYETKNARLDSQVQLLAAKLREVESEKETQLNDEVQMMVSMTQTGKERDTLIHQLREELRSSRSQNASLLQEREIILEKLVVERNKATALEAQLKDKRIDTQQLRGAMTTASSLHTIERGIQTGDSTAVASQLETGERGVEALREHIELEQSLLHFHQNSCTVHAANIQELHERLQRRLQQEVRKLQDEQDKYTKLMTNYGSLKPTNISSPVPAMVNQHAAANTSDHAVHSNYSSVTKPQPSASPFFQQQEEEMKNLRRRLEELQHRHQGTNNVTSNNMSNVSVASNPSYAAHKSSSSMVLDKMLMDATRN